MPSTLSIINDVFRDPAERARAIGAWAGTSGLGIAIGPIAGGLLLARFWWGSIFLVNVPIVVAGIVGAVALVPDSKNPAVDQPDPGGAVLSIAGFGLLLWAIIEAPTEGWTSPIVVGVGLASLAVLASFVAWEVRSRHPMLRLEFFADRRFSIAAASETLALFGLLGALFMQTQFLQFDLGYSPLQAGLRILPIAALLGVTAPVSPLLAAENRAQAHCWGGPGGDRRRAVADRCDLHGHDDLRGRGARNDADRSRGRAVDTDCDELCSGFRATGQRWGRIGHKRSGLPSRRCARRRRDRKCPVDPLPGSHEHGTRRTRCAGDCRPCHHRFSRRRPHRGKRGRRRDRAGAGPYGACRVHERRQDIADRSRRRRTRRRIARARAACRRELREMSQIPARRPSS